MSGRLDLAVLVECVALEEFFSTIVVFFGEEVLNDIDFTPLRW